MCQLFWDFSYFRVFRFLFSQPLTQFVLFWQHSNRKTFDINTLRMAETQSGNMFQEPFRYIFCQFSRHMSEKCRKNNTPSRLAYTSASHRNASGDTGPTSGTFDLQLLFHSAIIRISCYLYMTAWFFYPVSAPTVPHSRIGRLSGRNGMSWSRTGKSRESKVY